MLGFAKLLSIIVLSSAVALSTQQDLAAAKQFGNGNDVNLSVEREVEELHPVEREVEELHRIFVEMEKELEELSHKEYRTINGYGNNENHNEWGGAPVNFLRKSKPAYQDGIHEPSGQKRGNPRKISNIVMHQKHSKLNNKNAADMMWQWGQFLDHDITLTPESEDRFDIQVPKDDQWFDPDGTGNKTIPFKRSAAKQGRESWRNGKLRGRKGEVFEQQNHITAYIDASQVYGSDEKRAKELRVLDDSGKLKVSDGDLLPFNENGFPNAPTDRDRSFFLAGDVRASEQVYLTAMHTIFVREHNKFATILRDILKQATGDEIYQLARRIVGAEMQYITYNEFLPMMIGEADMGKYNGYDKKVNAGIATEFSTAAYRVGHTMLSSKLHCYHPNGKSLEQCPMKLVDAFFNTTKFKEIGPGALLRGVVAQMCQDVDSYVIEDVRNFLFGPKFGFLDLAALNIQRGRDHGIGSYNDVRKAYKLKKKKSFDEVCSDKETVKDLASAYKSVDDIDLWVGCVAEDHMPGAMVGETIRAILHDQFTRLRNGDRFWYQHDLPEALIKFVESQTLGDVMVRNTDSEKRKMPKWVMQEPKIVPT